MMNEPLQKTVNELESHLPELVRQRASDAFANDLYEAAYYWCELGRWVLENNTKVNYPERVRGERELLAKLQGGLQNKSAEEQLRYGRLLNTGGEILRIVGAVKPPRDGHLGFLRIVRGCFQFLQLDYGFSIADEQPMSSLRAFDSPQAQFTSSLNTLETRGRLVCSALNHQKQNTFR
jgi:hypothetical protein